jgi:3D-(3,5/4)-trihydroxycyclohexane-1,2-dione acylhydrolase (decyclizing)
MRTRTIAEFRAALAKARTAERITVVYVETDPLAPVPSSQSWWDVPVAQTAALDSTRQARQEYEQTKRRQRSYL